MSDRAARLRDALAGPSPRGALAWVRPGPVEAALEVAGAEVSPALAEVLALAFSVDAAIRPAAVRALVALAAAAGGDALDVIGPDLIALAEDPDREVAAAALETLAVMAGDDAGLRRRLAPRAAILRGRVGSSARGALAWLDPIEGLRWLAELATQPVPLPADVVVMVDALDGHDVVADAAMIDQLDGRLAALGGPAATAARRRLAGRRGVAP